LNENSRAPNRKSLYAIKVIQKNLTNSDV